MIITKQELEVFIDKIEDGVTYNKLEVIKREVDGKMMIGLGHVDSYIDGMGFYVEISGITRDKFVNEYLSLQQDRYDGKSTVVDDLLDIFEEFYPIFVLNNKLEEELKNNNTKDKKDKI